MKKKDCFINKLMVLFVLFCGYFLCNPPTASADLSFAGTNKVYLNSESLLQQQIEVTGTVTNAQTGEPLPGVNIVIQGTTTGTTTDMDGDYSIEAPPDATLVFSFVGFQEQSIRIQGREEINVSMNEAVTELEEVVAIGYGTMKKSDLTGSISTADDERVLDKPATNLAQAMSGKIAGVEIMEQSGRPGGSPLIRVRGVNSIHSDNSPLVVVDGVAEVSGALTELNPRDIQSVEVLKDASATAIYGARGANGVILITTKKGKIGETQVEYHSSLRRNVMQSHFPVLNSEQFLYVVTQAWLNNSKFTNFPSWNMCPDGSILPEGEGDFTYGDLPNLFEQVSQGEYSIPLRDREGNYYKPRFDTNWESETFKPTWSTDQQLVIRGGTENANFGAYLGYTYDDGLLINSYFDRYSGKITGDFQIAEGLDLSAQINVNQTERRTNDRSYFSGGIARASSETFPVIPPKYPNDPDVYGSYAGKYADNRDFPVGEVDCQSPVKTSAFSEDYIKTSKYLGYVKLNYEITEGFTFRTNFSVDNNLSKNNYYGGIPVTRGTHGDAHIDDSREFYWQNENYFDYENSFGSHNLKGLLGLSWSERTWEGVYAWNNHFFDDFYKYHNIGVGNATRPVPSSWDGESSLNSYWARANYNFRNKYYLTVTGRVDGSSKFGPNNKYGFFPSGAVAWRISEEPFMQGFNTLSNAKVRFSIGQTGNQNIGSYVTQAYIGSGDVVMGEEVESGLWPSSVGNPDLRWEKNTQYDVGFDLGLFDNRIIMNFDYYYKLTEDMLLDVPLPQSTTTGSVRENYGSLENKGFEVTLSTQNVRGQNFNWSTDITFSRNKNKVVQLGPTGADIRTNWWVGGPNAIIREGESVGSFLGLTRLNAWGTREAAEAALYGFEPGDKRYEDTNNDGKISFLDDATILGNGYPKWRMNFYNTLRYKNLDLSLDISGAYGLKKENRTNHSSEDRQVMDNNKTRVLLAWRPDYQNTNIGQVRPGMGGGYYQTYPDTHWLEDASYIRGEGLTLGYTLNNIGINKLRVYLSASNFFLITGYSGYDPVGSTGGTAGQWSLTPNMDFYMYPRPSVYTLGVDVTF